MSRALPLLLAACVPGPTLPSPSVTEEPATAVPAVKNNAVSSLQVEGIEKESFAGKTANTLDAARIAQLDRFIEEALVMANVPGTAVAVVQDGAVVLAKG